MNYWKSWEIVFLGVRTLLEHVRQSQLFSIIADESRDISNTEQLTCVLKWVNLKDMSVNEDFIGMYELEKTDAQTVFICSERYHNPYQPETPGLYVARVRRRRHYCWQQEWGGCTSARAMSICSLSTLCEP